MKTEKIETSKTMVFPMYEELEPEDLIIFNQDYLEHISKVMEYVSKNEKSPIRLLFRRIHYSNGTIPEKSIWGVPQDVKTNFKDESFVFSTNENMEGGLFSPPIKILIRPRNVLGMLPFLTSTTIKNPFEENSLSGSKDFFEWLIELKKFLEQFVGTEHFVKFFYKYSKRCPFFRNGNYHVVGKISKVNLSNVEYTHYQTFSCCPEYDKYVNLGELPGEVDRFIAPDRYLWKVIVYPEMKNTLTSWDDGEEIGKLVLLSE